MPEENRISLQRTALLLCVFSFLAFSFHLEQISLYHTDEQYYIQSCRNMVDSGDWLTPILNEEKRFAKPILFYWLTSLFFKVLGIGLPAARLVSALFGAFSLWIVFRTGTILHNTRTGLYAIFILASSYLYFLSARLAYTDMTLCFFITLSLFFFSKILMAEGKGGEGEKLNIAPGRNIIFFYLSIGLATATKGPPGFLIPGLIIAAFLFFIRDRETARRFIHPIGILLFLIISLFWPLAMVWLHGQSFMDHLIHAEGTDRLFHGEKPSLYFFFVVLRYFAPWCLFLVAAAFLSFGKERKLLKTEERRQLFLWFWIIIPLILFTFIRIQHSRYMLPAFPALAIITGHYFDRLCRREIDPKGKDFQVCFYIVVTLYLAIFACFFIAGFFLLYFTWQLFHWSFFLLAATFFTAAYSMIFCNKRGHLEFIPLLISLPLLVSFPFLAGKIIPSLNPDPMMEFAREIDNNWKPATRVGTYRFGNGNQRLRVLTGRPVKSIDKKKDLIAFLKEAPPFFFVIREEDLRQLPIPLKSGLRIAGEGKKWKKIKVNSQLWNRMKKERGPELMEELKERVFLVY